MIANNPGITLSGLRQKLDELGITVTERTLAKDINSLKNDYQLLPDKPRLKEGYVLNDIFCFSSSELETLLDSLFLLGARMDDPEASSLSYRLGQMTGSAFGATERKRRRKRSIRNTSILEKDKDYEQRVSTIYDSISRGAPVEFVYNTPRLPDVERRSCYPLMMLFYERGWYCIARELSEKVYFPNRLDRISDLRIVDDIAANTTIDEDIEQASYLVSCGWGMTFPRTMKDLSDAEKAPPIVVRFDRTVASYLLEARERHPKAKIYPVNDGTGDVIMEIHLSRPKEFLDWVRSFGARAWVVSPSSLVSLQEAEIRRMLERYRQYTVE